MLAAAEQADEAVWNLFLEPEMDIEELPDFAAALATKGSSANQAYSAIKGVAQRLPLKDLIELPDYVPQKSRRFSIEVSGFINAITNNKMTLSVSDRQLAPLEKILDTAAAALLRLENLRVNHFFSQNHSESYTQEAVALYREEVLQALAALADPELLEQLREKASADTQALLEAFEEECFIKELVASCRDYVEGLQAEDQAQSLEQLKAAMAENPL